MTNIPRRVPQLSPIQPMSGRRARPGIAHHDQLPEIWQQLANQPHIAQKVRFVRDIVDLTTRFRTLQFSFGSPQTDQRSIRIKFRQLGQYERRGITIGCQQKVRRSLGIAVGNVPGMRSLGWRIIETVSINALDIQLDPPRRTLQLL